ncbi:MAG: hypothetical protein ACR2N4_13855 [Jatrophihabitans sp.]
MPVSDHASLSVWPLAPLMWPAIGSSVARKPVATISTSISRSVPSAVTTPVAVSRAIGSVISSTLSRASVGYQSLEITTRLQPNAKFGVTRARSAGSLMPRRMLAVAARLASVPSWGSAMNIGTVASRPKYTRLRIRRCTRGSRRISCRSQPR